MLILDQENTYSFSNMTVKITDNTVLRDETTSSNQDVPDFNVLIPIHVPVGTTNSMELYYPTDLNRYLNAHGEPNCLKNGFGAARNPWEGLKNGSVSFEDAQDPREVDKPHVFRVSSARFRSRSPYPNWGSRGGGFSGGRRGFC